jgi:hypothetical protein
MAKKGKSKKNKEDIEKDENINEGTQEDINEADDSFGLPDIDFKPLDEIEDEPEEEQTPEEEEVEEVEEIETSTETETSTEDDFEEEFVDDTDNSETEDSTGDVEPEATDSSFTTPPRRFEHPEESSSMPKIIIGILLAIIVIAAGWYFGMYKPQQEKAKQELAEQQKIEAEAAKKREEERQAALARQQEAAAEEEVAEEPPAGTFIAITEPTGRYYVVIASFVDGDLGDDYGKELSAAGTSSMLLSPKKVKGFYRLALSDHESWSDAQSAADQKKGEYGDNLWVLKY